MGEIQQRFNIRMEGGISLLELIKNGFKFKVRIKKLVTCFNY